MLGGVKALLDPGDVPYEGKRDAVRGMGAVGVNREVRTGLRLSRRPHGPSGRGADAPRYLAVCAFPYLLAFTTDSMEIRLVVNGNLVHTAVVPQLQLVASRVSRPWVLSLSEGLREPQGGSR